MVAVIAALPPDRMADILRVAPCGGDSFEGATPAAPDVVRLFGGHLLGQALLAAYATVAGRGVHVLHAQFLRPGMVGPAIRYDVERLRDGRSFSTRQVRAVQDGRLIFTLTAAFHGDESGVAHQDAVPVPGPLPAPDCDTITRWGGAQIAPIPPGAEAGPFDRRFWFRIPVPGETTLALRDAAIAYGSDLMLGTTPLLGHAQPWAMGRNASLDHSVWFHRPSDPSQWTLFAQHSPTASGGRGFTRGTMQDAGGVLIASVAQESLIRP